MSPRDNILSPAHVTVFTKSAGALTKELCLDGGKLKKDASQCLMVQGQARKVSADDAMSLAGVLESLGENEAISLGVFAKTHATETVEIVTNDVLSSGNDAVPAHAISRSLEHFSFPQSEGWMLVDLDLGEAPPTMQKCVEQEGPIAVLGDVLPLLEHADYVLRPSTSAKLYNSETGDEIQGSKGVHLYVRVIDATDIPRATRAFFDRCILADLGWIFISRAGQQLPRTLVDATVGSPERLVFEAPPVCVPPVAQKPEDRAPQAHEGVPIDTRQALPDLSPAECKEYRNKVDTLLLTTQEEAERVAANYDRQQVRKLAAKHGCSETEAKRMQERKRGGVLSAEAELHFDRRTIGIVSVSDVLADPESFDRLTLADPLEGIDYGRGKAKLYLEPHGIFVHSMAHGLNTTYKLTHTSDTIRSLIDKAVEAGANDVANTDVQIRFLADFAAAVISAELSDDQFAVLREYAIAQTGIGSRVLSQAVSGERSRQRRADAERRAEERASGLPRFVVPEWDAPFGPTLNLLETVLSADDSPEPPMRDVEGKIVEVQNRVPAGLHQLGTGDGVGEEKPAPPAPMLVGLEMNDLLSLVEQHVEFYKVTRQGDIIDVRLPNAHAQRLRKLHPEHSMLPVAKGVCTLPFLLPDGTVMHGEGLDRNTGLIYRLEPDVLRSMPQHSPTDDEALAALMWMRTTWLCDVETDWTGFTVGVSMMLSMIQRMVLPGERPAFVVNATQRGAGKTTFGNMVSAGVLGKYATAARWSTDQEELRKAMLPYISADIPLLVFDNTHRGQDIDSDALNAALTTAEYSDRVLGASSVKYVEPRTVIVVNGNNIRPAGDFASRALLMSLKSDRADPENRDFTHKDPLGFSFGNRGKILNALYTLLLWNPRFERYTGKHRLDDTETRFRMWYHMIGSPLEAVSRLAVQANKSSATEVRFAQLFLDNETQNPTELSRGTALSILADAWQNKTEFAAREIIAALEEEQKEMNDRRISDGTVGKPDTELKLGGKGRELLEALDGCVDSGQRIASGGLPTSSIMGVRLEQIVGAWTQVNEDLDLVMRVRKTPNRGNFYWVETKEDQIS